MPVTEERLFRVRSRRLERHDAHTLSEMSFEAAAVAYLERWQTVVDDGVDAVIIVQELSSGVKHCFRIDLETGMTAPCD